MGNELSNILTNLSEKKKELVQAYIDALGLVSAACNNAGVSRFTFYEWMKVDPVFKQAIEESNVKEHKKDFIEHALIKLIKSGNPAAVIFAAKTQCKDRGYIEKSEIDVALTLRKGYTTVNPDDWDEPNDDTDI